LPGYASGSGERRWRRCSWTGEAGGGGILGTAVLISTGASNVAFGGGGNGILDATLINGHECKSGVVDDGREVNEDVRIRMWKGPTHRVHDPSFSNSHEDTCCARQEQTRGIPG
jgi:hypothetical protein